MDACLFCQIAGGKVPADTVHEDDDVFAFRDIHPKYPVHVLVIPKIHLGSAAEATPGHDALLGKLLRVGAEIAAKHGLREGGFRLLLNTGPNAGQVVPHLHLHVLGGQPLRPI